MIRDMNCRLVLISVILCNYAQELLADEKVELDLIRHQPCVWREVGEHFQVNIFIAISNTANRHKPPETCHGADANGCGGFGSWRVLYTVPSSSLYCSACETFGARKSVARAVIMQGGKQVDCNNGELRPGTYEDISLKFCLPSKTDFLSAQGVSEEALLAIFNPDQQAAGAAVTTFGLFASVYVFDKDVRPLMRSQAKLEQLVRRNRGLGPKASLDRNTYWSLPFNQLLQEEKLFIACHKLYGNVRISP